MEEASELLPGAYYTPLQRQSDGWADSAVSYSASALARLGLGFEMRHETLWFAGRDVIRGMHVQVPPHADDRLLYCAQGAAMLVLLDLRRRAGFGRARPVTLDAHEPALVLVPAGVAHGFKALEDHTLVVCKSNLEPTPRAARGVRWNSFGFDWRCAQPRVSDADNALPALGDFQSPF